jgi:hypothetical protein
VYYEELEYSESYCVFLPDGSWLNATYTMYTGEGGYATVAWLAQSEECGAE